MVALRALALLASCPFLTGSAFAQTELQLLRADDGSPGDQFGFSLHTDGVHALISAPNNLGVGAVYAFRRDDMGTPENLDDFWYQSCKVTARDGQPGDRFGHAVDFDGTLGVFGAPLADDAGPDAGAVYVFYHDVQGTPDDPSDDGGFQLAKLTGSRAAADQRFGRAVAINGSTIVVGTRGGNLAYVFERDDAGTPDFPYDDQWFETAVLEGSADGFRPGRFGWSVAIEGDTILVGARWTDVTGADDNSGIVYVFDRNEGTSASPTAPHGERWIETARFTADVPVEGGEFGRDVALEGDLALIGAWMTPEGGRAYTFRRDRNGTPDDPTDDAWSPVDALLSIDGKPQDGFGNEVFLNGNLAVVGGDGNDLPGLDNAGAAYVYARQADYWYPVAKLNGSQAAHFDHAGRITSVETLVIVGAPNTEGSPGQQGGAYVFDIEYGLVCLDFETEDDLETPLLNGQEISSDEEFGRLVAIDGLSSAGLEAAIFDSSPFGPNDTSTDPDLLVGQGNLLILQELSSQSTPDVYDFPDDDAQGGVIDIEFLKRAASVVSLDLIDVDPGAFQDVTVVMTDIGGRTRSYTVPSGWTEDVAVNGPPGYRTLNVLTLSEQPGFLAVSTIAQSQQFDPTSIVRMQLRLSGSAAVDNLKFYLRPDVSLQPQAPRGAQPGRGGKKGRP